MLQNYEITFVIGIIGAIFSFVLLLISFIKNIKILKIISIFIVIIFIGITLGYYYENLKTINNKANNAQIETKVTSGSPKDPIIITERTFYSDDNYYYSEFEINNNTDIEISKISFHIIFTYESKLGVSTHDEHIFLLDSVIPPNKTIGKSYIWKKDFGEKGLTVSNLKLGKIENLVCYVNINDEEKAMKLNELNAMLKDLE